MTDPKPKLYKRGNRETLVHKLQWQDRIICGMTRHLKMTLGAPVPGPCLSHDHSEDLG